MIGISRRACIPKTPVCKLVVDKDTIKVTPCPTRCRPSCVPPEKHFLPDEIKWQWTPVQCHISFCPHACFPKVCPKYTLLDRLLRRTHYRGLDTTPHPDPLICKAPVNYTLSERIKRHLSYICGPEDPDAKPPPKPKLVTCRKLNRQRRNLCIDPDHLECVCSSRQKVGHPIEYHGEGRISKAQLCPSSTPESLKLLMHPIPACVQLRRTMCPPPKKCLSLSSYETSPPFGEFRRGSICPPPKPQLICAPQCPSLRTPPVFSKSEKLSCRPFAEFKTVDCPRPLFSRFKSVNPCNLSCPVVPQSSCVESLDDACDLPPIIPPKKYSLNIEPCHRIKRSLSTTLLLPPR